MVTKNLLSTFLTVIFLVTVISTSSLAEQKKNYLVISKANKTSSKLIGELKKIGDVQIDFTKIGVVSVSSSDPEFTSKAKKISGVLDAVYDAKVNWLPDEKKYEFTEEYGNPPTSGDDDIRFDLQWGHDAIDAPEAWNAGYRGKGARVAVLDTGFDLDHPDLAPNINLSLSTSYVPDQGLSYALPDPYSHGSHTAGTIAAADNSFGTIGVAPEAELVLIKVLTDGGSGAFSWIIAGMYHAAIVEADVISMSIGAYIPRHSYIDDNNTPTDPSDDVRVTGAELQSLILGLSRAANFAHLNGSLLIASAGNDAVDLDHVGDYLHIPSDIPKIISISATAPIGWAIDPENTFLSNPASYTNYGQSRIGFAAPGGDYVYPGDELTTVAGVTRPVYVFDFVFSTGSSLTPGVGSYYWSVGTSMAAPHAAGVAAIIIGANPDLTPSQVEGIMKKSAVDLGKPGNDDYYGTGLVNAYNAINAMRLGKENPITANGTLSKPTEFNLAQNFPNPFNPTTTISYQLPVKADVSLKIYNVQGKLVRTLVSGFQDAGYYSETWNGKDEFNKTVASGIYFYKISAGEFSKTAKMMLIK